MKPDPQSPKSPNPHNAYRSNRTGEDIDMLNESHSDPESSDSGSDSYKNDIDGA
jgi:hypothetical protein